MVHHAEMKWFTQRSPSSQPIALQGEPLARLTHCAAKLAWLCRFHAKAAACTRCWELVGPCDNQSLWAPLSSWDRLRCCWASQRALFRPILSSCLTFASVCFTFETVALSKLLLASIMLSGPKHAAWLAHYTRLTCWPDQDPLCVLLLPEEVHSLVEDNKEYWHWFESIERHYWIGEENRLDKFSETDQISIRHWMRRWWWSTMIFVERAVCIQMVCDPCFWLETRLLWPQHSNHAAVQTIG